jgi:23S rRNA (guanosine2251-2'-O)-methyltransferase
MDKNVNYEYIYGINPVYSLIVTNAGRRKIYSIIIDRGRRKDLKIKRIIEGAKKNKIEVLELVSDKFGDICSGDISSQGIGARVSPYNYLNLDDYLNKLSAVENKSRSRLIILDGVTDAGNFGSIIRNCHAFGFDGIIIPERRSVTVNERVSKISAGALEEVLIFRAVNIVRTIKELKNRGFWIYGTTLDIDSRVSYLNEVNFTFPMAIVMGSEDRGISRLVKDNCDFMISIRLSGRMQSLNVSVASGIILYKVQEQIEKQSGKAKL